MPLRARAAGARGLLRRTLCTDAATLLRSGGLVLLPEARATFWHTVHVQCYRISSLRTLCISQGLLLPTQPLLKLHPLIVLHPLFFRSAINAGNQGNQNKKPAHSDECKKLEI
jgi:hypothetical protein